ncbi:MULTISPECIES: NAD(P)-dependent alcohol dehydrogenase [unclassified Staphylococcus]|uniref:zinc-dependent alcohol dehydrogenase family protein n=1 Tax=Staphylococcus TaxID=1279 RepID=UPI001AEC11DB|nr:MULTISPECIES: NAD(P)-dependent alcohol dehydrogenase [unclassified Staphylococcus]
MRAWQLEDFGLDCLKMVDVPTPEVDNKQVLIEVKAISLNYRDRAIIEGNYAPGTLTFPFIPTSDFSGKVVQVGKEVTQFKVNDRVISRLYAKSSKDPLDSSDDKHTLGGPLDGGLAEYVVLDEDDVVALPGNLSYEAAATLPIAAFTAWLSLVHNGALKSSDTVLIQGTGDVSLFGIQIAASVGANIIATSSSNDKLSKLESYGVTHFINYTTQPNWENKVLEVTNRKGVDHILEVVGGNNVQKSISLLAKKGKIYFIGFLESAIAEINFMQLAEKQAQTFGINTNHHDLYNKMIEDINHLNLHPVIDSTFDFNNVVDAYQHLYENTFGKVVIKI